MTVPATPPNPRLERPLTGFGIFLMVIGIIIALPSGLCSATLLGLAAYSLTEGEALQAFLVDSFPMLLASFVPLGIGLVLIWAGFKQRKART